MVERFMTPYRDFGLVTQRVLPLKRRETLREILT